MDSRTDGYSDEHIGTLTCNVTGTGKIEDTVKTTAEQVGAMKRYLAIPGENGTYTFHRFYVGITHLSLNPANVSFGYKAAFYGDETVKGVVTGFGYNIWVNLAIQKPPAFAGGFPLQLNGLRQVFLWKKGRN